MLTSVLNGVVCIVMAYSDPLLLQTRAQQVKYHYGHTQVEDANLGRFPLPIFYSSIKKITIDFVTQNSKFKS